MNYFHPHGTIATLESHLGWWLMLVSAAVVLVVVVLVLAASVRGLRAERGAGGSSPRDTRTGMRWIYVGGLIVPATILVLTMGFTLENLNATTHLTGAAVTIRVVGHRWWWEVRYERPGGIDSVVTANEIHIPVGQPVKVLLSSADVVHSFWIPQLAGKTDANPGSVNVAWLEADTPGTYRGQCTEYCGLQHANMAAYVIAEPAPAFNAWLAEQRASARTPDDPIAARGASVFLRAPCASCHTIRGTAAAGAIGPDLTHVGSRSTLAAGALANTRGGLEGWIANAQAIKPGSQMPRMYLSPGDLRAVVAYIATLR